MYSVSNVRGKLNMQIIICLSSKLQDREDKRNKRPEYDYQKKYYERKWRVTEIYTLDINNLLIRTQGGAMQKGYLVYDQPLEEKGVHVIVAV